MEPESLPPFAPDAHHAGGPVPDEPPQPRLGILHLLVLTACVAAYLGITRTYMLASSQRVGIRPAPTLETAVGGVAGIASGAALAGLLLFLARRFRGMPFPRHPGEYLLVMMGVNAAVGVATMPLNLLSWDPGRWWGVYVGIGRLVLGINALIWIWALIQVKILRWRVFFLSIPASYLLMFGLVLQYGGLYGGMHFMGRVLLAPRTLPLLVLAVVLLKDHFDRTRYPWTHWYGVGTRLWLDAATLGMYAWRFASS